jgi:malonate transporter
MASPIYDALIPVVLLIGAGFMVGKFGWVRASGVKDVSNLAFLLLAPALLFRSMTKVHPAELDFKPVMIYFCAIWIVFLTVMFKHGFNRRAAVMALSATFSNILMIGVPLVGLAYGETGLVPLLALISVHSLIMLTMVTSIIEFTVVAEQSRGEPGVEGPRTIFARLYRAGLTLGKVVKSTILHPVPLPILCGLAFGMTGWQLPLVIDNSLLLLGQSFPPVALVLVGITLAFGSGVKHLRTSLGIALTKNLLHPLTLLILGVALGLSGLNFKVMLLAAALPIGANVYLFALRYQVAEEEVTASVALSTVLGLVTLTLVMSVLEHFPM